MKLKQKRNEDIMKMRDKKKLSFAKIGDYFNIKRQTVHEIYHREKKRQELSTV